MKIALMEDRIERMKQFLDINPTELPELKVITGEAFSNLINELKGNDTNEFDEFDCLIAHRSAFDISERNVIKSYCRRTQKPLIFFSGGISSSFYNDRDFAYLNINSRDLYSGSFKLFIKDSVTKGKINLLILQFGERWKLNLLLDLRNNLGFRKEIGSLRRVRDLEINNLIRAGLIEKFEMKWLENELDGISPQQIVAFSKKLDVLINSSI